MKIVKKPNGYQYALFKGGQEISTRTKNREKAQQIAKEGNWEALDLASQAQALTADVITRLVSGGKKRDFEGIGVQAEHEIAFEAETLAQPDALVEAEREQFACA